MDLSESEGDDSGNFRSHTSKTHILAKNPPQGGEPAKCALLSEVTEILRWAHDFHGHFSIAITLHKLRGQWFWPTRVSDVERHCWTCHICQIEGPRKKSTTTQSIAKFHPMAMVVKSARAPPPKLKKDLKPASIKPTSNDIEDPLSGADVVVTYLLSPGAAPVANMTSRDEPSIELGENFRCLDII